MNFFKKIYYSKYSNKSYSISYVDLVVNRIFSKIKKGIYVDLGCNHPIKVNNTYYRSFYLPSITPINDSSSSTLNASFKLKLNQNDLVTFESNYKLSSCFIDFD